MTFQQLYYLLEVEKTGSFSQAAKKLYVTQSTISNSIASLEREVGGQIFIRGKKALTLTAMGESVIAHAKRICESHRFITTGERPKDATVRIGTVGFPPVREAFLDLVEENRDRADIQFVLHDARNKNFDEELLAGRMDVAVAMFTNAAVRRQEENLKKKGFYYEKLLTLPAAVCIGPGHRLYDVPDFPMEELRNDRFIELPFRTVSRQNGLSEHLPVDPRRVIGTTHADARKELIHRGLGYTLTYMRSAQERAATDLRYVPVPGLTYTFYVFYDPLQPMTPEIARFLELLKAGTAAYTL